jgi:hypothetical protein
MKNRPSILLKYRISIRNRVTVPVKNLGKE